MKLWLKQCYQCSVFFLFVFFTLWPISLIRCKRGPQRKEVVIWGRSLRSERKRLCRREVFFIASVNHSIPLHIIHLAAASAENVNHTGISPFSRGWLKSGLLQYWLIWFLCFMQRQIMCSDRSSTEFHFCNSCVWLRTDLSGGTFTGGTQAWFTKFCFIVRNQHIWNLLRGWPAHFTV